MTGKDLLEGLSGVDGRMIEAAAERPQRWKRGKGVTLAACLAALLVVSAVAVEVLGGVRISEIVTGWTESGYQVQAELEPMSSDQFSPKVKEWLVEVWREWDAKDWMEQMVSSRSPGFCDAKFETWTAAVDFLGVELTNPLEREAWLTWADRSAIVPSESDHCGVLLYGDRTGAVAHATLQAGYLTGEVRVALRVELYTEAAEEFSTGSHWAELVEFQTDTYRDAILVTPEGTENYSSIDAYLVRDNALYCIHVVAPKGEETLARDTLERLLDCF